MYSWGSCINLTRLSFPSLLPAPYTANSMRDEKFSLKTQPVAFLAVAQGQANREPFFKLNFGFSYGKNPTIVWPKSYILTFPATLFFLLDFPSPFFITSLQPFVGNSLEKQEECEKG